MPAIASTNLIGGSIVIAALSARMLAQSARHAGLRPIALDIFGDVDTRRAAHWLRAGQHESMTLDPDRLRDTLARLGRRGDLLGWVAGSGFELHPSWLDRGARHLRLLGNDAATVAYVKNPHHFFDLLDALGIAHPEVRFTPPDTLGWLRKQIGGSGGWHVRRWVSGMKPMSPTTHYFQRERPGTPMSLMFLADGENIAPLGFNQLLCEPLREHPFAFAGVIGPVPLAPAPMQELLHATRELTRHLGLRGLNGIDFILHRGQAEVLEINPRPPATLALYDERVEGGLMGAHVAACEGRLTPLPMLDGPPSGMRIVHAERELTITPFASARMQALGWCHDLPRPGTRVHAGEPWCSVSATAGDLARVTALLAQRVQSLRDCVDDRPDPQHASPALATVG
jgi:predicted ATP-grasp superfamily ATP-dependent carboligase